jgi:LETM1 and EF-hand domain-containing protein 1
MLQKGTRMFKSLLFQRIKYGLLNHNEMEKAKEKFFGDQERTLKLKIKFILKETKYTIVQGSKDLWQDAKWIIKLYKNKKSSEFTGYEMAVSWRIVLDILKFIPYSVLLAIPLAEVLIPVLVWIFPNAIPSFFLFDTAEDKRIENF